MDSFKDMFCADGAFAPFYCDSVKVCGVRPGGRVVSATVRANVIDNGFDAALADGSTDTLRRSASIDIRRRDWPYKDKPQIGDTFTAESGERYSAMSVTVVHGDAFHIEARTA